ncbi:MAG: sigma-54-dependent Fis family transcriptional regulator [Candidatus Rokubacteria bacterium]|nr:sigma-54-dependent Fis family transcriptional regulator [Candidatus Rokubacteria bacterium]
MVDDDPVARRMLSDSLGRVGYTVVAAATAEDARKRAGDEEPALAILDLVLPDGDGIELLGQLRGLWPAMSAIVVTAYVEPRSIVEAMRRGAVDYLAKPIDPDVLLSTCRAALARRPAAAPAAPAGKGNAVALVGASPEIARIRETLERLNKTRAAGALIVGDHGVGKTFLAHALHAAGVRRGAPCLLLPYTRTMAPGLALFGSVAGSGLLAASGGGTVVLDDVERLDETTQTALVQWMESQRGSAAPMLIGLTTDAGAGGPLVAWLGRARIDVPPLAARTADILPLARHFVTIAATRHGRSFAGFTAAAEHRLLAHTWPGNAQELMTTMERVAATAAGTIQPEHLALSEGAAAPAWVAVGEPRPLREIEDAYIDHVIAVTGGNKTRAAQLLGIARETLRSRTLSKATMPAGVGERRA